ALDEADFVLVIDSDVPWIPTVNKPRGDAVIYQIDVDPLKDQMPLWQIPARRVFRADAATALSQINERLDAARIDEESVKTRRASYARWSEARRQKVLHDERFEGEVITPAYLTACVRRHIDQDTIVLNEGITNHGTIIDHLGEIRPGQMLASGGGSLGWNGGAGHRGKAAGPEKALDCMAGEGAEMIYEQCVGRWAA